MISVFYQSCSFSYHTILQMILFYILFVCVAFGNNKTKLLF
nr:MAG TPA: hypothetical protein [Caudoviricetes sp.]